MPPLPILPPLPSVAHSSQANPSSHIDRKRKPQISCIITPLLTKENLCSIKQTVHCNTFLFSSFMICHPLAQTFHTPPSLLSFQKQHPSLQNRPVPVHQAPSVCPGTLVKMMPAVLALPCAQPAGQLNLPRNNEPKLPVAYA
jgi:hypothetical protein